MQLQIDELNSKNAEINTEIDVLTQKNAELTEELQAANDITDAVLITLGRPKSSSIGEDIETQEYLTVENSYYLEGTHATSKSITVFDESVTEPVHFAEYIHSFIDSVTSRIDELNESGVEQSVIIVKSANGKIIVSCVIYIDSETHALTEKLIWTEYGKNVKTEYLKMVD